MNAMTKRWLASGVGVAVIAASVAGWHLWRGGDSAQAKVAKSVPGIPVRLGTVTRETLPVTLQVIGRGEAKSSVVIRSRLDGQVAKIEFKEGQPIRQGQVLIQLDPSTYQAQLRQAEATRAKDVAQLDKLRKDFGRNTELFQKGFISQAALSSTQADLESAEAAVQADTANIDNVKLLLSFTTIRAPMDAVPGAIQVYPGGTVKANDTALVTLNQMQPVYVTFAVPDKRLPQLRLAMSTGGAKVRAVLPGDTGKPLEGSIVFLDNAVDATTGTITARALFPNTDNRITPGQFVEVTVPVASVENALVVPGTAVQSGPRGEFVYVVKDDQSVELRTVKSQLTLPDRVALASGVQEGERVVVDGQFRLTPGAKIRPVTEAEGKGKQQ
jgi:multidrug efflux system membrane fusion protein